MLIFTQRLCINNWTTDMVGIQWLAVTKL